MNDAGGHNIWRSYSDMMSGLLLLFVLIMAVCLMQAQKNYNDRLAEQASRLKTQDELEQTQDKLTQRESEIEAQSLTLTDLQSALEIQAAALATKPKSVRAPGSSRLKGLRSASSRRTASRFSTSKRIARAFAGTETYFFGFLT